MTEVSTHAVPSRVRNSRDQAFVQRLLVLRRDNATARSALRRGDTAALADRAIPYLDAWNFREPKIPAALLFAAAICRYTDIAHDAGTSFGRAAFRTLSPVDRSDAGSTNAGRRVVAAQRQGLLLAHRTFTGLLTSISSKPGIGFDWTGLWRVYRQWDDSDLERQRATRRRLLLDFYGTNPTSDVIGVVAVQDLLKRFRRASKPFVDGLVGQRPLGMNSRRRAPTFRVLPAVGAGLLKQLGHSPLKASPNPVSGSKATWTAARMCRTTSGFGWAGWTWRAGSLSPLRSTESLLVARA